MTTDDRPEQQDDDTGRTNPEPPICAYCGGVISEDDLVCPHCGRTLVGG